MPSPGDLTEAISLVRERCGFGHTEHEFKYTVAPGRDPETGTPITVWLDLEHQEFLYRAQDCPEGREFLEPLRRLRSPIK